RGDVVEEAGAVGGVDADDRGEAWRELDFGRAELVVEALGDAVVEALGQMVAAVGEDRESADGAAADGGGLEEFLVANVAGGEDGCGALDDAGGEGVVVGGLGEGRGCGREEEDGKG